MGLKISIIVNVLSIKIYFHKQGNGSAFWSWWFLMTSFLSPRCFPTVSMKLKWIKVPMFHHGCTCISSSFYHPYLCHCCSLSSSAFPFKEQPVTVLCLLSAIFTLLHRESLRFSSSSSSFPVAILSPPFPDFQFSDNWHTVISVIGLSGPFSNIVSRYVP